MKNRSNSSNNLHSSIMNNMMTTQEKYSSHDENQGLLSSTNTKTAATCCCTDITNDDTSTGSRNIQRQQPSSLWLIRSYVVLTMLIGSIIIFYIGWYIPRRWMNQYMDWIIARNPPPYQIITTTTTTATTTLQQNKDQQQTFTVLDPTYNHPVIDPPQISSSFLIFTSVTLPLIVLCIWPFLSLFISYYMTTTTTTTTNYPLHILVVLKSLLLRLVCRMTIAPKQKDGELPNQYYTSDATTSSVTRTNNNNNNNSTTSTTRYWKQHQQQQQQQCVYALYECIIGISGLLCSIGITEGVTQCIKMYIGRLRPNMYQLCQFNLNTLDYSIGVTKERIREGHLSFPSGHSSLASVSMIYCTWYILFYFDHYQSAACTVTTNTSTTSQIPQLQQAQARLSHTNLRYRSLNNNNNNNELWMLLLSSARTLIIVLLLPGWAVYVGMTRIVDHWHHVSDVLAGLVLGSVVGTIGFRCVAQPIIEYIRLPVNGYNEPLQSNRLNYDANVNDEQQRFNKSSGSSTQMSILPTTTTTDTVSMD